jgi:hypothetical protein
MGGNVSEGMNWQEEVRDMFRGLVFLEIKKAESNTLPGMSLKDIHAAASSDRDGFGTLTQMHHEVQRMVAEGLIYEVEKDFYRVVEGAKPPGNWSGID